MHPNPRKIAPVILFIVLIAAAIYYLTTVSGTQAVGPLSASGTVEAVELSLAPEISGRVVEVLVNEGDLVTAGQMLVRLDDSLLQAQLAQARAALAIAEANYALAAAGQPAEQRGAAIATAELELLTAQQARDALFENADLLAAQAQLTLIDAENAVQEIQEQIDRLPARTSDVDLVQLEAALTLAEVQLEKARADNEIHRSGPTPDPESLALIESRIAAAEARLAAANIETPTPEQLAVAQAQVDAARAAMAVLETQIAKTIITAPIESVVLTRLVEPGEIALPNAPLLTLVNLNRLTLTVYAPEDRYGEVTLGQSVQVTADSFPGQPFHATVTHIADQAEFTPRNVQTQEGRRTTVFAIKLALDDTTGKLKPGMPADVVFGE
jgi:HlyD family secretion protein